MTALKAVFLLSMTGFVVIILAVSAMDFLESGGALMNVFGFNQTDKREGDIIYSDGRLCLANMTDKFSIPLDRIKRGPQKIPLLSWNKEKAYNDKQNKQYKIIRNNIGV